MSSRSSWATELDPVSKKKNKINQTFKSPKQRKLCDIHMQKRKTKQNKKPILLRDQAINRDDSDVGTYQPCL
jgi:hypothetical protein